MKAKKRTVGFYLSTAIGFGLAVPAYAQSTGAPAAPVARGAEGEGTSDIIVTARRTEERLQDVPISITVFTQAQLANRNIVTAGDLGTYTPSLSTNSRFGDESTSFAIRGFVQDTQTAPSVGVFFADVVSVRTQGGTTAGNGAGAGSFFDLQNVQVLKGPQGTLFGRNTTGGSVLLVPQKPTSRWEGYLEGSYGNYDMKRVQGVINAPLNATTRVRLGFDWQQRDGYLHNISGIGPKDFNNLNYYAVRASIVSDLTPDLENYLIGSFSQSDTNGFLPKVAACNPAASGLLGATLGPLGCAQVARDSGNFYNVENGNQNPQQFIQQWQLINTTTWHASDTLTIKNIASYGQFRQKQSTSIFGDNFSLAPGVPISYVGLYNHPGFDNTSGWTMTEEFQLQGRSANDRFTYQGGIYYEQSGPLGWQSTYANIAISCTNVVALQCSDPVGAGLSRALGFPVGAVSVGNITDSRSKYKFYDLGLYAQATYKITDQLSLTGGIRWTSDKIESTGQVRKITFPAPNTPVFTCAVGGAAAPDPTFCTQQVSEKSKRPTWLVDLDYKPTQDIMIFAKYARGYRQGGVNVSNPGFTSWGPEKVDDYEVGLKSTFGGALHATFDITGFYDNFTSQQLQVTVISPTNPEAPVVNAGKSRIAGVEVDASISPFQGFTLNADYTYLSTKLQSITYPALPSGFGFTGYDALPVGNSLTLSPKNRVTLTGSYTLPLDSSIGSITVAATFTHTDKSVSVAASPVGTNPATDLVNLNLNWRHVLDSKFDLALFATNVTNKHYWLFAGGSYTSAGYDGIIVGQPRMYGLRVKYNFGR